MSDVNYKKMSTELVVLSIFLSLITISGCTSTEKKSSTNATVSTNQQSELITEDLIDVAHKGVTQIKASPKLEAKITQPIELEQKPIIIESPKKVETKIKESIKPKNNVAISLPEPEPEPEVSFDSLSQLPLTLKNGWAVTIKTPPLATKEICVLYHEKNGVFDGYKDNNIKLYLTLSQLLVKSDSNFDLSYPDTGVYVEDIDSNSSFYSLTPSSQKTIAVLALPLNDYLESSSINLVVKSGFWPTWPITDTKEIIFPVNDFNAMINTLNTCASLLTEP